MTPTTPDFWEQRLRLLGSLIKDIGFPIVVCLILLYELDQLRPLLTSLSVGVASLTTQITELKAALQQALFRFHDTP